MIIKKHTAPNWLAGLNTYIFSSQYSYRIGILGLLFMLAFFSFSRNVVVVSPGDHFYSQPVVIKLRSANVFFPYTIRYTTDGSSPTAESQIYDQPFSINTTSVLRVALFDKGTQVSKVFTHPLFIDTAHQMPVVSLVTDKENLFDPQTGIYMQPGQRGEEWERPAHMTFFEPNGKVGFRKDIGLRIHGVGTRIQPQKSFRIYAGYLDHTDQIKYPLFPDAPQTTFNTFILRAGGDGDQSAFIRDAVMQKVATGVTTVDAQAIRPAVVYINNEYWGMYFIQERIDQYYLANKYGISKDKLSIVGIPNDISSERGKVLLEYGSNKAVTAYNELYDKSYATCTGCTAYNEYAPHMDLPNFQDYLLLQTFAGNFDWPFGNVNLWRYEQPTIAAENEKSAIDGRFRWIFFDLDTSLGATKKTEEEMIGAAQNNVYNRLTDPAFPYLNVFLGERFQQEFITRLVALLNTELTEEYLISVIDELVMNLESEVPAHIERWSHSSPQATTKTLTVDEWEQAVELIRVFVRHRHPHMFESTAEFFELSGVNKITLDSSPPGSGDVSIGEIHKTSEELPWEGTFFQDTLMVLEAHPDYGYIFDHWEGDIPKTQVRLQRVVTPIKAQENITAVFRKRQWYEYLISKK